MSTPKLVNSRRLSSPYPKSPISTLARKFSTNNCDDKGGLEGTNGFTRPVAVCFALNYVVGTGFLVLPWVFVQAGLALSVATVVAASFVADVAKDYVLVSMARAEYFLDQGLIDSDSDATDEEGGPPLPPKETDLLLSLNMTNPQDGATFSSRGAAAANKYHRYLSWDSSKPASRYASLEEATNFICIQNKKDCESPSVYVTAPFVEVEEGTTEPLIVKQRTIELSSLSDIFLGKTGLFVYTFFLSIYMYMMLWAYTSVFAQALALSAPIPGVGTFSENYTIYTVVFCLIVVPMSFVEVEDQIVVQITLTVIRAARLLIMIATSLCCSECFDLKEETEEAQVPMFRLAGFHLLLPIIIAANLMHEAIPDLSHPVQDKTQLGRTFTWVFVCTGVIYSVLGASVGQCFGQDVEPSSNLNWKSFHSPHGRSYQWVYSAMSYFVVCSPALDVISAYPLNAIALGNNLMEARCGSVHDIEASYFTRMMFRVLAAVPPMIGALFVRDLGVITDYAGIAGIAVAFCITSLLFVRSGQLTKRGGKPAVTYYDSYGTNEICALVIFGFGVVLVVGILYELIKDGSIDE